MKALKHSYIILVRYYESENPDAIDVIEFEFPEDVARNVDIQNKIMAEYESLADPDRNISVENACDIVAERYGGTWKYLVCNSVPLEIK